MTLEKRSFCKVNLLLNILGRRADGFHELETVLHPVPVFDRLSFERGGEQVALTCSDSRLPVDSTNLIYRATVAFLQTAHIHEGVRIHLDKHIPMAAGLGGGSGNGAATLLGLNELFGQPLGLMALTDLAASLGSDVPFFLQNQPALATSRGEHVTALDPFPALRGLTWLLIHPGFGVPTAWAYRELGKFPEAFQGKPGRARQLITLLQGHDIAAASSAFYNALEAPVLHKYPVLALYQEFLRRHGALATLMSGSGSTTFALMSNPDAGKELSARFKKEFGHASWTAVVPVDTPQDASLQAVN